MIGCYFRTLGELLETISLELMTFKVAALSCNQWRLQGWMSCPSTIGCCYPSMQRSKKKETKSLTAISILLIQLGTTDLSMESLSMGLFLLLYAIKFLDGRPSTFLIRLFFLPIQEPGLLEATGTLRRSSFKTGS